MTEVRGPFDFTQDRLQSEVGDQRSDRNKPMSKKILLR
jgi:hypothetical protein